jgi:hypothetical protein
MANNAAANDTDGDDRTGCIHFINYLKEYDSLNRIDSLYIREHCTNTCEFEKIEGYDRFYECDTCEKLYCFSCGFDRVIENEDDLSGFDHWNNDTNRGSSDYCNFCMQKAYDQFKNTSELELFKGFLKRYYSTFVLVKISDKILTSFCTSQKIYKNSHV